MHDATWKKGSIGYTLEGKAWLSAEIWINKGRGGINVWASNAPSLILHSPEWELKSSESLMFVGFMSMMYQYSVPREVAKKVKLRMPQMPAAITWDPKVTFILYTRGLNPCATLFDWTNLWGMLLQSWSGLLHPRCGKNPDEVLMLSAEAATKSTVFTGTTCLRLNELSHETTRFTGSLEEQQRLPGRGSGMFGRRTS